MDRAHRIGQKKVVNVYRLITRGTLEEKIMGSKGDRAPDPTQHAGPSRAGMKGVLESLPELWDSSKYDSEYDLGNFLSTLRPK
ncbi:hypothetical protein HPB52_007275 [Rhipicephalus sanguineus]|uniref:Uncharacterized protein n=1 Tax=Rhipicephalus sanguineus TaxID=34632 RepID=A0A9D4PHI1_RHISA|nr:hypothetical protein HPB52_007275 [Rhipicephalus sanguineus]